MPGSRKVFVVLLSVIRPSGPLQYQSRVVSVHDMLINANTMARTCIESAESETRNHMMWKTDSLEHIEAMMKMVRSNSTGETWTVEVACKIVEEY